MSSPTITFDIHALLHWRRKKEKEEKRPTSLLKHLLRTGVIFELMWNMCVCVCVCVCVYTQMCMCVCAGACACMSNEISRQTVWCDIYSHPRKNPLWTNKLQQWQLFQHQQARNKEKVREIKKKWPGKDSNQQRWSIQWATPPDLIPNN